MYFINMRLNCFVTSESIATLSADVNDAVLLLARDLNQSVPFVVQKKLFTNVLSGFLSYPSHVAGEYRQTDIYP